jgi:transposase
MERSQRRSFTDDYKRQAVDLVASSGRSIGSVAKELGLRDSVLRRYRGHREHKKSRSSLRLRLLTKSSPLAGTFDSVCHAEETAAATDRTRDGDA